MIYRVGIPFLILILSSGCNSELRLAPLHSPYYNPGGINFENDPEFYRSYNKLSELRKRHTENAKKSQIKGHTEEELAVHENKLIPGSILVDKHFSKLDDQHNILSKLRKKIKKKKNPNWFNEYCIENIDLPEDVKVLIKDKCENIANGNISILKPNKYDTQLNLNESQNSKRNQRLFNQRIRKSGLNKDKSIQSDNQLQGGIPQMSSSRFKEIDVSRSKEIPELERNENLSNESLEKQDDSSIQSDNQSQLNKDQMLIRKSPRKGNQEYRSMNNSDNSSSQESVEGLETEQREPPVGGSRSKESTVGNSRSKEPSPVDSSRYKESSQEDDSSSRKLLGTEQFKKSPRSKEFSNSDLNSKDTRILNDSNVSSSSKELLEKNSKNQKDLDNSTSDLKTYENVEISEESSIKPHNKKLRLFSKKSKRCITKKTIETNPLPEVNEDSSVAEGNLDAITLPGGSEIEKTEIQEVEKNLELKKE